MFKLARRALSWIWANLGNIVQMAVWLGGFAVTAWAAAAANLLSQFAPFSYVVAGLLGSWIVSSGYWLIASARTRWVRTKYDNTMMLRGGLIDPLAKTFESKRIYLSEFVLPSHPIIEGKTFIDCEIIGPANLMLISGNNVADNRLPHCDALALAPNDVPHNRIMLSNCVFRSCSFQRVTFFISAEEFPLVKNIDWLRWIGNTPGKTGSLPLPSEGQDRASPYLMPSGSDHTAG
jgi:hypothetical protein